MEATTARCPNKATDETEINTKICSEPKEKKDNGRIHFRCRRQDKQGVCEDKAEQACSSGVGH